MVEAASLSIPTKSVSCKRSQAKYPHKYPQEDREHFTVIFRGRLYCRGTTSLRLGISIRILVHDFVIERSVPIDRTLCGDDALDLDLLFQVARLGKIKGQLHSKPCFGCRAECL